MFTREQIKNKIDVIDKRSYNAPLKIIPTSILTAQTLARLRFQLLKKSKSIWKTREVYQFR